MRIANECRSKSLGCNRRPKDWAKAFVKAYRERGWSVVGNAREIKPSDDPDYITVPGDIGDPDIARKVVETALDRFGRVDTLINNAGIWRPGPIASISEEMYRRVMATNVDTVFFATQAAVPAMQKQGGAISSGSHKPGRTCAPRRASGSRLAVKGSLRFRDPWTRHGTRQRQYPSQRGIAWHHQDTAPRPFVSRGKKSFAPLNRYGEVADVVRAINYLEDSDFVTGEISYIDGGRTAGH